jgi:hypothetical protein
MAPEALFVAQSINQVAWALMTLAGAVLVAAVVMAVGYWAEYQAWRADRDKVE